MCLAKPCWLFPNPCRGHPLRAMEVSGCVGLSGKDEQATRNGHEAGHEGLNPAESREEPAPFQPE